MATTQTPLPEKLGSEHSKQALRLWLRLLTTSTEIEKLIRGNLTREFGTTLPRFDILAALDRNPEGLTMGALSKLLMVSNGNVTGLVDRLVQEELVEREAMEHDRRTYKVTMTKAGKRAFRKMANRHEEWLDDMLEELPNEDIEGLLKLLSRLRSSVAQRKINRD
ncbi:MAG: MarR family transcriptional regulator [Novosphingobium sp.]|nr:MarR family transcriptional regulator [Novosphingobium sp.]